ncbi:MAG: glycosyltransferase family 1 protein [Hyphomonadaceae bacterium]|nr:glycosyltransferase family 1 protein [Hyphomonadaceae bacterium]
MDTSDKAGQVGSERLSAAGERRWRILIDGDHRADPRGRGLSTYSRTLGAALEALGNEVSWLIGADAPAKPDAVLEEVMAFDRPAPARGLRLQAQTAARMAAGLVTPVVNARKISVGETVVPEHPSGQSGATYLAPNLFVHAHYRHMLTRQFTEVRVPDPIDVLHLSAPVAVKMRGVKTVTSIHDLIPIRLPYTTTDNKAEFTARVRRSAAQSDLIITVSEASKKDIVDILGVDPAKIAVTYQPADIAPLSAEELDSVPRVLGRFGLEPQAYALFVGALEPKKNLRRMIEAFLETESNMPLAIVGGKAWMLESELGWIEGALGEAARKRLRFLGYVDREDIRRLYAGAQFFLFPSLYEGFGLPPLEAMTMGCPVVTSNVSSLPEVCGEAALYANPLDRDDIRSKIEQMMGDKALRASLAAKSRAQAEKFSPVHYAERLAAAYDRLGS